MCAIARARDKMSMESKTCAINQFNTLHLACSTSGHFHTEHSIFVLIHLIFIHGKFTYSIPLGDTFHHNLYFIQRWRFFSFSNGRIEPICTMVSHFICIF